MVQNLIRSAPNSVKTRPCLRMQARLMVGFLLAATGFASPAVAQQSPNPMPRTSLNLPEANPAPDANDRMQMQDKKLKRASFEAANAERKRQLDSDSALLLKLASELKAEIDRTPQDTLSLSIVRKAEEIEHLAHNVQLKMKLTVGTE